MPRPSHLFSLTFATLCTLSLTLKADADGFDEPNSSPTHIQNKQYEDSSPDAPTIQNSLKSIESPNPTSIPPPAPKKKQEPSKPFDSFTGKISKNNVRMRVQPSLDSPIVKQLNKDELLIITGEDSEFYSVRPPTETKAYVFRTYILDGQVEGNHVNVRLEPDVGSFVIAQLNTGDRVEGNISPIHSKWMEIAPPDAVRFYICKEYVEKVGDANMMALLEKRRNEVNQLLESTYALSRQEMQKPFDQIALEDINHNLEKIVHDYNDFHEQAGRAKALQQTIAENYLQKRIAYLETKAQTLPQLYTDRNKDLNTTETIIDDKIAEWLPVENNIYASWADHNTNRPLSDFYEEERNNSVRLTGIIAPYTRPVRNKSGDFMLLDRSSKLPIAFLYSTIVNLQNYDEKEITIHATPRSNNNFAFPAYFVLSVE